MMRYINRDSNGFLTSHFRGNVFYKKKLENSHTSRNESCDRFISSKPFLVCRLIIVTVFIILFDESSTDLLNQLAEMKGIFILWI